MEALQPLTKGISTRDLVHSAATFCGRGTYLGTECGIEGAGMWHSLSGLMEDKQNCLDLARCLPLVRAEYQPCCVGAKIRARGAGVMRIELKSPEERVLWWGAEEVPLGDDWQELTFSWDPARLRKVKSLHWTAEPGTLVHVDSLALRILMPDLTLEEEAFLVSYGKIARLYSQERGLIAERALRLNGERDSVAVSGLFCLATSVAYRLGMVKQTQAEQILHKVHALVSELRPARGLLPTAVKTAGGKSTPCKDESYSVLDNSLYYHGMLLAAQLLWDGKTLAGLINAIRGIRFNYLWDQEGFVTTGLQADGKTPARSSWRDWRAETALVALLEHMVTGEIRSSLPANVGVVPGGVGLGAELGSLFYPDFSTSDADAVTGADWSAARRALLDEQLAYFPRKRRRSAAAHLGLYGLSTGEDPVGEGFVNGGARVREKREVIRPYYMLMSDLLRADAASKSGALTTLKEQGLVWPWGIVSALDRDLEYPPLVGSFSGALECLAAYHLLAHTRGESDLIHGAVEDCGLLREAIRAFYPPDKTW